MWLLRGLPSLLTRKMPTKFDDEKLDFWIFLQVNYAPQQKMNYHRCGSWEVLSCAGSVWMSFWWLIDGKIKNQAPALGLSVLSHSMSGLSAPGRNMQNRPCICNSAWSVPWETNRLLFTPCGRCKQSTNSLAAGRPCQIARFVWHIVLLQYNNTDTLLNQAWCEWAHIDWKRIEMHINAAQQQREHFRNPEEPESNYRLRLLNVQDHKSTPLTSTFILRPFIHTFILPLLIVPDRTCAPLTSIHSLCFSCATLSLS